MCKWFDRGSVVWVGSLVLSFRLKIKPWTYCHVCPSFSLNLSYFPFRRTSPSFTQTSGPVPITTEEKHLFISTPQRSNIESERERESRLWVLRSAAFLFSSYTLTLHQSALLRPCIGSDRFMTAVTGRTEASSSLTARRLSQKNSYGQDKIPAFRKHALSVLKTISQAPANLLRP